MTRWVKSLSVAAAVLIAVTLLGTGVVGAQGDTGNPQTQVRGQLVRNMTNAVIDAIVQVTGLAKADILKDVQAGKKLADIITAKGGSISAVKEAAKKTITDATKKAVTDGKLKQNQADLILKNLDTALDRIINAQPPKRESPVVRQLQGAMYTALLRETATQTKTSQRDLLKQLRENKTLTQIAQAGSVEVSKIVDAVATRLTTQINRMVTNGRLKSEEAQQLTSGLKDSLTKLMNSPAPNNAGQRIPGKNNQPGQNQPVPTPNATPKA